MMNTLAAMPIEPFLALTDDALSLLEQALAVEHPHEQGADDDEGLSVLFRAIDALGFAILRYRQDRSANQPDDNIPY